LEVAEVEEAAVSLVQSPEALPTPIILVSEAQEALLEITEEMVV
jgi:hypothetical protein